MQIKTSQFLNNITLNNTINNLYVIYIENPEKSENIF